MTIFCNDVAGFGLVEPVGAEVFEVWVCGFYQVKFLLPSPGFYLFFAGDSGDDVSKCFKIQEAVDVVFLCEARDEFLLVLVYAFLNLIGKADVEGAGFVGQYVDIVLVHGGIVGWIVFGGQIPPLGLRPRSG